MLKKNYLLILLIALSYNNCSTNEIIIMQSENIAAKILLAPVVLGGITGAAIGLTAGTTIAGSATYTYYLFKTDTQNCIDLIFNNSLVGGIVGLHVGAIVGTCGTIMLMIYGGYKGTVILYKKIKEYLT